MRWLAQLSIRNRVVVHLLTFGLVLAGLSAWVRLPRELMSEISFNWVFVRIDWPGAAPQEIEQAISLPVEEALDRVEGVSSISVRAKEGYSFFSVKFESVADDAFDQAYSELKDELDSVDLPDDAEDPFVLSFSSQDFVPMVSLVLSGELPEREMKELAERVKDDIEEIDGVGKIEVGGVRERRVLVAVDPDRLSASGVPLAQVSAALAAANLNVPGGTFSVGPTEFLLRTVGQFESTDAIGDVILAAAGGSVVRLRDVAQVVDGWAEETVRSRFEDKPAVTLNISKQAGENSLRVIQAIKDVGAAWQAREGDRIRVAVTGDTSVQIGSLLSDLQSNAMFGMILVVGVLWLFLGLRNALLTAGGIPMAFLATFVLMDWLGETLNGNSLFGLVLVLGIIVDDAIVLVENTVRHRAMGKSHFDAVVDGMGEVGVPVIAAVATTVAAFLPLMLMPGLMGKFLRIIPMVVSLALLASLAEALLSLPAHVYEFGDREDGTTVHRGAWFDRVVRPYAALLQRAVSTTLPGGVLGTLLRLAGLCGLVGTATLFAAGPPVLGFALFGQTGAAVATGGAALIVLGLLARVLVQRRLGAVLGSLWSHLGRLRWLIFGGVYLGMVPAAGLIAASVQLDLFGGDEIPKFFVHVRMPEGTALDRTDAVMRALSRQARATVPATELSTITENAGLLQTDAEWFIKPSVGQLVIDLKPRSDREEDLRDVMSALRPALLAVPGPESLELVPANSGPPAGADVELKVQGPDLDRLVELSEIVRSEMLSVPGVVDVRSDWVLGKSELRVRVDEDRAALLGVTERDVALALRTAYDGQEATQFTDDDERIPVVVRLADAFRQDLDRLRHLRVAGARGGTVALGDVALIEQGQTVDAVRRYKGRRTITLQGSVDDTITTSVDATQVIRKRLADFDARYPGYRIDYSGEFEEFARSLSALGMLGAFGLLLVYLILGAQFKSFLQPFIIIGFTFPGALFGAALALLISGTPLSLLTLYGVVALLGIVVNDSLVFIDFINEARARDLPVDEAIIEAGQVRLRPIVLTTVTTVFGLLPMALGIGGKSAAWGPLATTIVCGLIVATGTTLLVIPPVYRCFEDLKEILRARPAA